MKFGENLYKLRKSAKMSQEKLSRDGKNNEIM